jgi:ABC-type antimicrobial peptide transport system permease subunit
MRVAFRSSMTALAGIGIYASSRIWSRGEPRRSCVRMALGAQRGEVIALVVRQALGTTATSAIAGLVGGVLLCRYVKTMLFGIAR